MMSGKMKVCPLCKGTGYRDENDVQKKINAETYLESHHSGISGYYETAIDQDFLGVPENYENFHDALKIEIEKLKEENWESSLSALLNIAHMSRVHPEMIDRSMPLITRSLHSLLKNVRPQVVRTACQIAEELFKTMQCTLKPEFDKLVESLLQKTASTNRAVKQDANRALDTMVVYISPQNCIRVMSSNGGARHKNAVVRTTVSRLLYNIVCTIGVETFLTSSNLRNARKQAFAICIQFLEDPSTETRSNGRNLMRLLLKHEAFDAAFEQDVERASIEKIEKVLVSLKYESKLVN